MLESRSLPFLPVARDRLRRPGMSPCRSHSEGLSRWLTGARDAVRRTAASLVVICLTLHAGGAAAQDARQARALFDRGVQAANQGRWVDAIDAFRRSRAIVERPSTVYNLAVALHEAGRDDEARQALEDYFGIADPNDPAERSRYGHAQALRSELTPEGAPPTAPTAPASTAPMQEVPAGAPAQPPREESLAESPVLWTLVAIAAVLLGVGIGVGVHASSYVDGGSSGVVILGVRSSF